jgi:hypothetical protein
MSARVELSLASANAIEASRAHIEQLARSGRPVYGVSTGFGALIRATDTTSSRSSGPIPTVTTEVFGTRAPSTSHRLVVALRRWADSFVLQFHRPRQFRCVKLGISTSAKYSAALADRKPRTTVTDVELPSDPLWPRAAHWFVPASGASGSPCDIGLLGVPTWKTSITPTGAHATPAAVREALRRRSGALGGRLWRRRGARRCRR